MGGQVWDAFELLVSIVQKAEKSIVLVDGYVDAATLNILAKKAVGVSVTIWTHPKTKFTGCDVEAFNAQYQSLEVRHTTALHDRFLILDGSEGYLVGASLKDAGKRSFAVTRIEDAESSKSFCPNSMGLICRATRFHRTNLPKFPTMPRKAVITLAVKKTKLNEHGFPIDDGRPYSRSNRRKRVRRHYPGLLFHELQRTSISLMIANCVDFRTASERASYSKVSATIHDGHPQRCLLRKRQNIRGRGWKVSKLNNKVPHGVESRTVPQRSFPPQELQ